MFKDKRGAAAVYVIFAFIAIITIGVVILSFWIEYDWGGAFTGVDTSVRSWGETVGPSFEWVGYIVGGIPTFVFGFVTGDASPLIIVIAMWLMIFLTFGDIFASFSSFSKPVAWAIGLLISIVAANLKMVVVLLVFVVWIFSFAGGLAVFLGLFGAFIAFIGINWGVKWMEPWILRRKVLLTANRAAIESEAGGEKLAGTIKGLDKVSEALSKTGQSNR